MYVYSIGDDVRSRAEDEERHDALRSARDLLTDLHRSRSTPIAENALLRQQRTVNGDKEHGAAARTEVRG